MNMLLIEDNPGDILLTQEALKNANIATKLSVARDGEEAIHYLKKESGYAEADTPDVIVLDLNLPRLDGREVLSEIKRDPDLRKIPVVVLTSSEAENDIMEVYNLYANCYIVKPVELEKYMQVVQDINRFWLERVRLPYQKNTH